MGLPMSIAEAEKGVQEAEDVTDDEEIEFIEGNKV